VSRSQARSGFAESSAKWEKGFAEAEDKWEIRFNQSDDKWERQFADLVVSQDARVEALERATTSFEDWRPGLEGTLDDVRLEVGKFSKNWERALHDRSPPLLPTAPPPSQDPKIQLHEHVHNSSVSGHPPAADFADRPSGHGYDNFYRADGFGSITTVAHPPIKGAYRLPIPLPLPEAPPTPNFGNYGRSSENFGGDQGRLPKLNFLPLRVLILSCG
jgi:hypothetical protein